MPLLECNEMAGESFPRPFAGVDEAGRGCLAGPVVAAAVVLPNNYDLPGLNDSKKLTEKKRLVLEPLIKDQAVSWGLGVIWPAEIDRINILQSTFKAMTRAIHTLKSVPAFAAIDGDKTVPGLTVPQQAFVGGDGRIAEISAASVLAKTFRDRLMVALSRRYPGYGLEGHKGYGTKAHIQAITELGPCRVHRLTFAKVKPEKPAKEQSLCLPGM